LFNGLFQDNLGKPEPVTRKVSHFGFYWSKRYDGEAAASAGPYANYLHLTPDR